MDTSPFPKCWMFVFTFCFAMKILVNNRYCTLMNTFLRSISKYRYMIFKALTCNATMVPRKIVSIHSATSVEDCLSLINTAVFL